MAYKVLMQPAMALAGLLLCAVLNGSEAAVPAAKTSPEAAAAPAPGPAATLPPYEFPWTNGLFASAAGYLSVKDVCFPCQRECLINVPNICCDFPVRAAVQNGPAPLVIVLLGIGGRASDDFNKLWASWYYDAGYHVLTFDSTFLKDFNAKSRHGVNGNIWVETELAVSIIHSFIQHVGKENVSKVGIVGMSYGAIEALMIGTMAGDKKLPFEVAAIQSYSPPIDMDQSAHVVDGWYADTYGRYTLVQLIRLAKIKADPSNPESPIPDDMLKAAVATSFRLELPHLIVYNDTQYCLRKLPRGDEFDDQYHRADHAARWGFVKFAHEMSYPYWQRKMGISNLEPLVHAAELAPLISRQPPGLTEVILAQDDPLNRPVDVEKFRLFAAGKPVTILPRGGHIGYVRADWTRAKLMTLFNPK